MVAPRRLCVRHPARHGIGICKTCGRVVCEECGGREEGILRCRECLAARITGGEQISRARRAASAFGGVFLFLLSFALLAALVRELVRLAALWGA